MEKEKTRVRFAPSPTGHLHTGSARTAFFNWLYAKKTNGTFILRVEDTDIRRHQEESIRKLSSSLKWLGILWDEGMGKGGKYSPYRQSKRIKIYKEYAHKLLEEGKAYRCFCTPEKLKEKRQKAKTYTYDRKCLKLDSRQVEEKIEKGEKFAIRILAETPTGLSFKDKVYGNISVDPSTIGDFIILRSNGLPTYNFSAAVDDALMEITDVIRGEDHLTNTPKQILLYRFLGFRIPSFAHLPMILGSDGQKLSKRHGSISIEAYIKEGFLPEGILNYLALLGWSYGEKREIFSTSEIIDNFSIKKISKKPARFDYEKLLWINANHIRRKDDSQLAKLITQWLKEEYQDKDLDEKVKKIVPLIKVRIQTLKECEKLTAPFFTEVSYEKKFMEFFDNKKVDAPDILKEATECIKSIDDFNSQTIEKELRALADKLNLNLRKLASVIRVAVWGTNVSPPLFETIEILGKSLTLKRLNKYLEAISKS